MVITKPCTSVLAVLVIAALLILAAGTPSSLVAAPVDKFAKGSGAGKLTMPSYKPGEVLVKFQSKTAAGLRMKTALDAGGAVIQREIGPTGSKDTFLLKLVPGISTGEAIKRLRLRSEVVFAEPNYLSQSLFAPSDGDFPLQWALCNTGQEVGGVQGTPGADIKATEAWDLERGYTNPVVVAVIDSGVQLSHPDLDSTIWTNPAELPGNGIDDDKDGYVDDVNGFNWAGLSQKTYFYLSGSTLETMSKELGASEGTQCIAQSIKGTGCDLTHIGVMLSKDGRPAGDIRVSLKSQLSEPDLGDFIISPSEVAGSPGEVYKPLPSPLTLQEGTTYYIVVETTVADAENHYLLYDDQSSKTNWFGYFDGQEYTWDGSAWTAVPADDLYFRTNPNPYPTDDSGHGTGVSGIIAAEPNGQGMTGISHGARIMPLKVIDGTGNSTSFDLCNALYYAADHGAKVINISLGHWLSSRAEKDAVNYCHQRGVVLFAAAGNYGEGLVWYPAGYRNVIGVGATNNQDQKASFSNHNFSVDVAAPGLDILTTDSQGGYSYTSGTSFATAHAAGLAALILSANPQYTPLQVEQTIEHSADDLGPPGRDDYYGYGRINAYRALRQTWAHDSIGTSEPAKDWYLAEGCTGSGFETWILVQNPNNSPAKVALTYMTPSGPITGPTESLPPNSRKTYEVGKTADNVWEVSTKVTSDKPVVAERAMYGCL